MFKRIFVFSMFLMCIFIPFYVDAQSYFDEIKTKDGVYVNCKESDGCVPLCLYESRDTAYDNVGIVGFSLNSDDDGARWQIGFTFDNDKKYLYTSGKYIPYSKVYKVGYNPVSASSKDDGYDGWSDTDLYYNLDKSFKCPDYMTVSSKGADGVCFGNQKGCSEDHPSLQANMVLIYNFVQEYENIAKDVYKDLKFLVNNNISYVGSGSESHRVSSDNDKIAFLNKYDINDDGSSNIIYNSSNSPEENAKQNCDYIKQYASSNSGIIESYIKIRLLNNKNLISFYTNELDVALQNKATDFNAKYKSIYTYDNLEKLMINGKNEDGPIYRKIGMNGDVSIFEDINNLFGYNATISVEYISKVCDIDLSVDVDGDGIKDPTATLYDRLQGTKRLYHANIYSDPTIDFGDKTGYDCSFLTDVADIISTGYFILEIAGLAILVILTAFDYIKIFLNDNADELKKANSNFLKRLIIAVILFLLPAIINVILSIFKIENFNSDSPLCVEISNK